MRMNWLKVSALDHAQVLPCGYHTSFNKNRSPFQRGLSALVPLKASVRQDRRNSPQTLYTIDSLAFFMETQLSDGAKSTPNTIRE